MLSQGQWHKRVPRDPVRNAKFRLSLLKQAENNPQVQRAIFEACKQDILFFVSAFVVQFNPKKAPDERVKPFIAWDFQEAALTDRPETTGKRGILWCFENNKTCVVEKSREVGASWLFLIFQAWLSIFFVRTQTLNISKSADAVDCKSPDSLFWKIRFINEYLPPWLRGQVTTGKMYIEYDRQHSVNTGEASTGRAGVGGRASIIFVDEFPEIKEDREVRERTANTSDCRFFNGTHKGIEKEFYNLVEQAKAGHHIVHIQMHWSQHPDKNRGLYRVHNGKLEILDKDYLFEKDYPFNLSGKPTGGPFPGLRSPWYDWKCEDIGDDRGIAMDLDINPQGAMSQFFNALTIRQLQEKYAVPPLWRGDIEYQGETGREAKLVERPDGRVRLWVMPDMNGKLPRAKYTAGCDVAWGTGQTPSVLTVFDADQGMKVMEYVNSTIEPTPFSRLVFALLSLFLDETDQPPRFCWEKNGPGSPFGKQVIELGYANVYYRTDELPQSVIPKVSQSPGWDAGIGTNKKVMLEEYRTALYEEKFCNRSQEALEETLAFRYTGTGGVDHAGQETQDESAARQNHGDRVIADGLAWKMARAMGLWKPKQAERQPTTNSLAGRRLYNQQAEMEEATWM